MIESRKEPLFLGSEGEEQYALLLSAVEAGVGFELFFVCCASRFALEEIRARLYSVEIPGIAPYSLTYKNPGELSNLLKDLLAISPVDTGRYAITVMGEGREDELRAGWTHALILLNEQRNRLIRACPSALLLMGPQEMALIAQSRAPDLWSVRSSVYIFPDPPIAGAALTVSHRVEAVGGDEEMAHELREGDDYARLAEALEGSSRKPEQLSRARLLRRAARAWRMRGEPEKARKALEDAESIYRAHGDEAGAAKAQRDLCDLLIGQGELDKAWDILNDRVLPVFCRLGDDRERAETLDRIANMLQARGELDEALRIRREEILPIVERLSDVRSRAVTLGKIADVLVARGELDEALRIRRDEQLPVYEKLGDVRSRAVTLGKIADVLQARGELDEALRIRRDEELPVYEKLGDVQARAVTLGQIADVLQARGELDEALRIRRDEELPVYEKLGDVRERALTLGKIADMMAEQGDVEECIRIYKTEVLPAYEYLSEVRMLIVDRTYLARHLLNRGARGDSDEAKRLLHLALDAAHRLRIPEARKIEQILKSIE